MCISKRYCFKNHLTCSFAAAHLLTIGQYVNLSTLMTLYILFIAMRLNIFL